MGPVSLLLGQVILVACGGQTSSGNQSPSRAGAGGTATNPTGTGGQIVSGAGGGTATNPPGTGGQVVSGVGGAATTSSAGASGVVCPAQVPVSAPTLSTGCQVVVRNVDPAFTCEHADCAITKALDLNCPLLPDRPWLSATADGAIVMVVTDDDSNFKSMAHLMTVEAANSHVVDVPALAVPGVHDYFSVLNSAASGSSSGVPWMFTGRSPGITVLRASDVGWTRATAVPAPDPDHDLVLDDASMIDKSLGYLTYSTWNSKEHHLATWDGSCWTDTLLSGTDAPTVVVEADAERRPWVAWVSASDTELGSIYLRSPSGDTQKLANVTVNSSIYDTPLRLLPGGLDGTATLPLVAARVNDGIRVLSKNLATDPDWSSLVLPESATSTGTSDCPRGDYSFGGGDPCVGVTSCTQQWNGTSSGFDMVRTRSGAVFAAWVNYSSQGSYALKLAFTDGEMPQKYCGRTETSGSGTAELVVARLDVTPPTLNHFRFDLGGAAMRLRRKVEMVARGDTLIVAAFLSGDLLPTLSYLEIDSRLLR